MVKFARTAGLALFLTACSACSTVAIQSAVDPTADFSSYKTFAWAPEPPPASYRPRALELDQAVKSSADRELAAKGLQPAGTSKPDLIASYFTTSNHAVYDGHYDTPYVVRRGSLTLELKEARTDKVIWEGTASDVLESSVSKEQVAEAIHRLIQKIPFHE